jgi:hypothetical protein
VNDAVAPPSEERLPKKKQCNQMVKVLKKPRIDGEDAAQIAEVADKPNFYSADRGGTLLQSCPSVKNTDHLEMEFSRSTGSSQTIPTLLMGKTLLEPRRLALEETLAFLVYLEHCTNLDLRPRMEQGDCNCSRVS